jgi:hypothetical protein
VVSELRQTEIHTAELVAEPSAFKVEMATEKAKGHISQGTDQIPAELIKEHIALRSINLFILFGIRRNCLCRIRSLYLSRRIKQISVITQAYHVDQVCTKF